MLLIAPDGQSMPKRTVAPTQGAPRKRRRMAMRPNQRTASRPLRLVGTEAKAILRRFRMWHRFVTLDLTRMPGATRWAARAGISRLGRRRTEAT